ncbi:MAG TPA: tRNA pseudouridine(55) synthase TruB [Pseudomonadales bacterium]|nr:tRNA pseudouridine(55) synthase TruB [Pseudomonadales bacterium]
MVRRLRGREISGMIVVDKPSGASSNDAVQRAKQLYRAQKVGHTGSLDPLATGVLPLCFGEATKFSQYLLDSDKKYWVRIKLGVRTDSGDADGQVVETRDVVGVDATAVERVLDEFRGEIEQIPSMFSAIKHQGQPLYKLARRGIEVERKSRPVTIYSNELVAFESDEFELEIHCSKGTYVRTIAEEIGEKLGCGAHVCALRRRKAGPYDESDIMSFAELEQCREEGGYDALDALLLPVETAVRDWPVVSLSDATAFYIRQGQPVIVPHAPTAGRVQLIEQSTDGSKQMFIGVGEILDDGRVAPRRLVVTHP